MSREGRWEYDPIKCAAWYIRFLQNALEKTAVPTAGGADAGQREARVRIIRAKADLKELELAEARSTLIPLADVQAAYVDLVLTTNADVMAILARIVPELIGEGLQRSAQAPSALENGSARPPVNSPAC
jgi:hypothetical protein